MSLRFNVAHWAAWAPELTDQAAWKAYLAAPHPVGAIGLPPLSEVQPMMRRRIEKLGRIALQAAYWGMKDAKPCPIVFASRYGDVNRSLGLLFDLVKGEPLSPTAFSMSVHNAIGALFSIARQDPGNYTAIAAGAETTEAAFTEALGLLADGEASVLVVYYEEPLPVPFQRFDEKDTFPRAWACRLELSREGGVSLNCERSEAKVDPPALSDLAALRFLLSMDPLYVHHTGQRAWRWQRHA